MNAHEQSAVEGGEDATTVLIALLVGAGGLIYWLV